MSAPAPAHLWLTSLVALLAAALALAGPPAGSWLSEAGWLWLRIPFGVLAVLVLPGHALATVVFPRSADLDGYERVALAIGLSLVHVTFLALALDRTPWGLSPSAMIGSLALFTVGWGVFGQTRLQRQGRPDADGRLARVAWAGLTHRPALTGLQCAAVLTGAGVLAATGWALITSSTRASLPPLTEFYQVGADGLADNYPRFAAPGEPISVRLGVTNRELRPMEYRIAVRLEERLLAEIPAFHLEAEETWSDQVTIALADYGARQRVDLLLFVPSDAEPYRRLGLVIDVLEPGVPTPVRVFPTPGPRR